MPDTVSLTVKERVNSSPIIKFTPTKSKDRVNNVTNTYTSREAENSLIHDLTTSEQFFAT